MLAILKHQPTYKIFYPSYFSFNSFLELNFFTSLNEHSYRKLIYIGHAIKFLLDNQCIFKRLNHQVQIGVCLIVPGGVHHITNSINLRINFNIIRCHQLTSFLTCNLRNCSNSSFLTLLQHRMNFFLSKVRKLFLLIRDRI